MGGRVNHTEQVCNVFREGASEEAQPRGGSHLRSYGISPSRAADRLDLIPRNKVSEHAHKLMKRWLFHMVPRLKLTGLPEHPEMVAPINPLVLPFHPALLLPSNQ